MTTSTTAAHTDTTAAGLITEAFELALDIVRNSMKLEDANEYSDHYTAEIWAACQRLREAGENLRAAADAAAERLGVDMTADVLEPLLDRELA